MSKGENVPPATPSLAFSQLEKFFIPLHMQTPIHSLIPSSDNPQRFSSQVNTPCLPWSRFLALGRSLLEFSALATVAALAHLVILPENATWEWEGDGAGGPGFHHASSWDEARAMNPHSLAQESSEPAAMMVSKPRNEVQYSLFSLDGVRGRHMVAGGCGPSVCAERVGLATSLPLGREREGTKEGNHQQWARRAVFRRCCAGGSPRLSEVQGTRRSGHSPLAKLSWPGTPPPIPEASWPS